MGIQSITRYDSEAVAVRIFVKKNERADLKIACERAGTNMSHLLRALALQWLDKQSKNKGDE